MEGGAHLSIELGQKVKVLLQVSSQNGLDNQKAKALEIHVVETGQKVVIRVRHEEIPSRGSMVILQNGAVVVQHRLRKRKPQVHMSVQLCGGETTGEEARVFILMQLSAITRSSHFISSVM